MKTHKQLLKEASILKQKLVQVENRIALTETRRMQKIAGILKEDLDISPVDTLIDSFLSRFDLTLTPKERAKFANAIEMDYEEGDISRATVDDAAEIFDASGIRSIEDDDDDDFKSEEERLAYIKKWRS